MTIALHIVNILSSDFILVSAGGVHCRGSIKYILKKISMKDIGEKGRNSGPWLREQGFSSMR